MDIIKITKTQMNKLYQTKQLYTRQYGNFVWDYDIIGENGMKYLPEFFPNINEYYLMRITIDRHPINLKFWNEKTLENWCALGKNQYEKEEIARNFSPMI